MTPMQLVDERCHRHHFTERDSMDPDDLSVWFVRSTRWIRRTKSQPLEQSSTTPLFGEQHRKNNRGGDQQYRIVEEMPHGVDLLGHMKAGELIQQPGYEPTASSTSAVILFKVVSSSSRLASKADSASSRGTQMGAPQRYKPREQGYGTMKRSQLAKCFFLSNRRLTGQSAGLRPVPIG